MRPGTSSSAAAYSFAAARRNFLWVDTDVGFDDLVALWTLPKGQPDLITTVGGMNDPQRGAQMLSVLFPDTPLLEGKSALPSAQSAVPDWLPKFRVTFEEFCANNNIITATPDDSPFSSIHVDPEKLLTAFLTDDDATENQSPAMIDLICLGPLTTVAYCLENVPNLTNRLSSVWILGGNLPEETTNNCGAPEFNFEQDPLAVQRVLDMLAKDDASTSHTPPIWIIPQDVCDRKFFQNIFSETYIENWRQTTFSVTTTTRTRYHQAMVSRVLKLCGPSALWGDPICLYARDLWHTSGNNNNNTNNNAVSDGIQWKPVRIETDAQGRVWNANSSDQRGVQVNIAYDIDLASGYLDWIRNNIRG